MTDFDSWEDDAAIDADERTAWLAWRKLGIGASDVAALCGMSTFASPMSVWADKMGLTPPDADNDYMEFGRRAEPMLTGYFEDRNPGLLVLDQQARVVHPDHPHHRATLDGRVVEHPDGDPLGVVEYKTGGFEVWDEIPDAYAIQVQWQMHVDQRDHAWFGVLHGRKYATYEADRDQRSIDMLIEVVDGFWHDHVLAEKAPPADAHRATAQALALAYPVQVAGESVPLDDLQWALDLREQAAAQLSDAKFNKERADNAIKAAIGDAETGTLAGEPIVTWKAGTRAAYTVEAKTVRTLRTVGRKK